MKLYKALVRQRLEVGISLVSPYYKKDKRITERVQRRATKMVEGLKEMSYEERLRHLKLSTLAYRRKRGEMIMAREIIFKNILPGLLHPQPQNAL
jgi:hypothetical protein